MALKSILENTRARSNKSHIKRRSQVFLLAKEEPRGFSQESCLLSSQSPTSGYAAAYEKLHCLQAMARRLQSSISLWVLIQAQTCLRATHLSVVCLSCVSNLVYWKLQPGFLQNVRLPNTFVQALCALLHCWENSHLERHSKAENNLCNSYAYAHS